MKKIDLLSVMELLESGDETAATTALHEWLVALGETAQNELGTEKVADANLEKEGSEAGEGDTATVNTQSTTPSPASRDPETACAVEINAEEHTGYELEDAPKVTDAPESFFGDYDLDELDEISAEGDKSAMLNSSEGFGTDSPPSPIAGAEGTAKKAPVKSVPKAADEPKEDEAKEEPKTDDYDEDESDEEKKD